MKHWRVDLDITRAEGTESFMVEADTKEEAFAKFKDSNFKLVDSYIEEL